jgi:hypothetical protein
MLFNTHMVCHGVKPDFSKQIIYLFLAVLGFELKVQVWGPEFRPQHHKTKQNKTKNKSWWLKMESCA